MRVRVDAGLSFESGQVSAKFVERLRRALSFENPQVRARARLRLAPTGDEAMCILEERQGRVRLPRGAVHLLRREADRAGLKLTFEIGRAHV